MEPESQIAATTPHQAALQATIDQAAAEAEAFYQAQDSESDTQITDVHKALPVMAQPEIRDESDVGHWQELPSDQEDDGLGPFGQEDRGEGPFSGQEDDRPFIGHDNGSIYDNEEVQPHHISQSLNLLSQLVSREDRV